LITTQIEKFSPPQIEVEPEPSQIIEEIFHHLEVPQLEQDHLLKPLMEIITTSN
jgi:hypothetical protein